MASYSKGRFLIPSICHCPYLRIHIDHPFDDKMRSLRLLQSSGESTAVAPPPPPLPDSNVVVILAAMLCALICVIGLSLVALCAWLRRRSAAASTLPSTPSKGLKKKVLKSLPSFAFEGRKGSLDECAICLSEFSEGDEIRALPECGHGFHVDCVDKWLGSHSSCPTCRRVLVAPTPSWCRTCGGAAATEEGGGEVRGDAVPTG